MSLPPPPSRERLPVTQDRSGSYAEIPRAWIKWLSDLREYVAPTDGILWSAISKSGSNLTDLITRKHTDLQDLNTTNYAHVSAVEKTDLTDGGESELHYHASDRNSDNFTGTEWDDLTDAGQSSLHGHPDTLINIQTLGTVTDNVTLNDTLAHSWSSGTVTGFALTDNGNGTINLALGEAMLRPTADEHDDLISIAVGATTNLALTDNSINYVYVNYNSATPLVQAGTSLTDFNCLDKCLIYTIAREGNTLYWVHAGEQNIDSNRKHRRMLLECEGFRHVHGGCALSATGTRNIAVTAGSFYYGLAKITHAAFDTSVASTFKYYYRDGAGGWTTTTGNTQINNTQYDDGTGTLATLGNNNYGVHWVYLVLDNPTILTVQFGQGDYATLSAAKVAEVPTAPPTLQGVGVLVGRIIIEKSAAAFSDISSAFTEVFAASSATSHAGLTSLAWTSSGHTGTASKIAGFDGTGVAAEYIVGSAAGNVAAGDHLQAIAVGGTGQITAQAAIDALTAVSAATNEHVLTKDTATGNAKWKASGAGVTLGVTAGTAVQTDQAVTAWTRSSTTTLGTSLNGTLSDTGTTVTSFNGVAGVTYHVRALGAGSITYHATDLIITQGLASITTTAGDTFDVEMLTATTCRIKNYVHSSKVITPYSCVRLNTQNGYGSTNTAIPRFTNVITNSGADITYADSAANGASFTINTAGVYAIDYVYNYGGVANFGISLNSAQLTTAVESITYSTKLAITVCPSSGYTTHCGATVALASGDVVRPHNVVNPVAGSGSVLFTITRVA